MAPVASRLRMHLGPDAVIYTNECNANLTTLGGMPQDLDLVSVDIYAGYTPGSNGTDEVAAVKQMYETGMFPNLRSHQQVMLVPGIFACSNTSWYPLEEQSVQVVNKLEGFFNWVRIHVLNTFVDTPAASTTSEFAQFPPPLSVARLCPASPQVFSKFKSFQNQSNHCGLLTVGGIMVFWLVLVMSRPSQNHELLDSPPGTSTTGQAPNMVRRVICVLVPLPCPTSSRSWKKSVTTSSVKG